MRLHSLRLRNFRCYAEEFEIQFEDMTAIVGRNDVGKSAIMDALAIFFEAASLDVNDVSKTGDKTEVAIACTFVDLPSGLVIDSDFTTTLAAEHLLNADGMLEVVRTFKGATASAKQTSVCAKCVHPTASGYDDLLQLKRADLVARADSLGVDLAGVNRKANAPLRAAIWDHCSDLRKGEVLVSLEAEGAKQVWASLSEYLPAFALFKSDRASTDQDQEAQDPLKTAIREAIKEVEGRLAEIKEHVEREVRKIADATVEKIREMDPEIAETLNPVVATKKWDTLFTTSITGENGIPLNKRGSGVKRLVLLNFFRAKAEKAAADRSTGSVIYAVEEPETSQHPRNQRMLMAALTELSAGAGRQVIITTHTPMLARTVAERSLRFIDRDTEGRRTLRAGGGDTNGDIARSLGILPDHGVKAFIGVEGPNDIVFLKAMSRIWREQDPTIPCLDAAEIAGEIIFFPMGGSNLALWSSRLAGLNRPEVHIMDRDNPPPAQPKYQAHHEAVNARAGCVAFTTGRREMENYIHHEAVCAAYAQTGIALTLTAFQPFDDVPEIVSRAVSASTGGNWEALSEERRGDNCRKAKRRLNGDVLNYMTLDRIKASDTAGETRSWLLAIRDKMMM
ncbi:ATP-binding protein [uncultured Sphingomonas sp.]|uniref:ATP-binding protein n=1 Tax=uncultured Sphingomonas sp. TaxID=158754 RepID=UPI0025DF5661|nr:ATP-binding protein [uncultured Sphingomonas sp.]